VEILAEGLGYQPADPLKGRKKDKATRKEKSKKKTPTKPAR